MDLKQNTVFLLIALHLKALYLQKTVMPTSIPLLGTCACSITLVLHIIFHVLYCLQIWHVL